MLFVATQALIKFKNYFYFEERDEQVDEFEKVCTVPYFHYIMMMSYRFRHSDLCLEARFDNVINLTTSLVGRRFFQIEFFKNGATQVYNYLKHTCGNELKQCWLLFQGVAWTDMYAGTYYPALSLYRGATVRTREGENTLSEL